MGAEQLQTLGFGSGILFGFPNGGQTGQNLSPVQIGTVQSAKVDIKVELKTLFGLYKYPVDSATGKSTINGSVSFAQLEGTAWNSLMFGSSGSVSSGTAQTGSYREEWTVPVSTYTVTVTNAAHFVQDGGVLYAANGQILNAITSGTPAQGEYTVSNGVYVFAAADVGASMLITYTYSKTTANATDIYEGNIPGTPYQITVPHAANYVSTGNVVYGATGAPLEVTSGTPSTGQYEVAAGVYTFAAADVGESVIINYVYSGAAAGQTFTIVNTAMGTGPIVGLYLYLPYESPSFAELNRGLYFPNVRFGNLSLATKLDDYTMEDTSFEAYSNPVTGIVMQQYLPW
jgi:hypothetical protein